MAESIFQKARREFRQEHGSIDEAEEFTLGYGLEFRDAEVAALRRVVEAGDELAKACEKLQHWHDTMYNPATGDTEGMVVSSNSVRGIWEALTAYLAAKSDTKRGGE